MVALPTIWLHFRQRTYSERNLASAFYGEISAIVQIYALREYVSGHERHLEQLKNGKETAMPKGFVERKYTMVYETNVDKLGILKHPHPGEIALFYAYLNCIHEDLTKMDSGKFDSMSLERKVSHYEQFLTVMKKFEHLGDHLQGVLRDYK